MRDRSVSRPGKRPSYSHKRTNGKSFCECLRGNLVNIHSEDSFCHYNSCTGYYKKGTRPRFRKKKEQFSREQYCFLQRLIFQKADYCRGLLEANLWRRIAGVLGGLSTNRKK